MQVSGGNTGSAIHGGGTSLRRCSATPNASVNKTGHCRVGMPFHNGTSIDETPKSAFRNSMFSPGEEFWCEAIQVADGLLPAVTSLPEGMRLLESRTSDNKSLVDESSCSIPQHQKDFPKSVDGVLDTGTLGLKTCLKTFEEPVLENNISLKVSQHNDASPLPVKHFDFSHEDSLHRCVKEKTEKTKTSVISDIQTAKDQYKKPTHDSNFQEHTENMKSCLDCKESVDSSVNSDGSSLPTGKAYQIRADLTISEKKDGFTTQENVYPSDVGHDSASREEKEHNISTTGGKNEAVGTPSSSVPPKYRLQLTNWLPSEVCNIYMRKGISELYPWQVLIFNLLFSILLVQKKNAE